MIPAAIGLFAGVIAAALAALIPKWLSIEPRPTSRIVQSAIIIALTVACSVATNGSPLDVTLAAALFCGASIDIEHMVLPLPITLGGAVVALASSPFRPLGWKASLIGIVLAFAITYLPHVLFMLIRGKAGQGGGDVHLSLLIGAWLGAGPFFVALFLAAAQAVLVAVAMRVTGLRYAVPESVVREIEDLRKRAANGDEEAKRELANDPMAAEDAGALMTARLPFGPFLALAAIEARFFGERILAWMLT